MFDGLLTSYKYMWSFVKTVAVGLPVMLKHACNARKRPQTWSKVKVCGRYVALQQGVWNMFHTALGLGLALIQYYTASWVG